MRRVGENARYGGFDRCNGIQHRTRPRRVPREDNEVRRGRLTFHERERVGDRRGRRAAAEVPAVEVAVLRIARDVGALLLEVHVDVRELPEGGLRYDCRPQPKHASHHCRSQLLKSLSLRARWMAMLQAGMQPELEMDTARRLAAESHRPPAKRERHEDDFRGVLVSRAVVLYGRDTKATSEWLVSTELIWEYVRNG